MALLTQTTRNEDKRDASFVEAARDFALVEVNRAFAAYPVADPEGRVLEARMPKALPPSVIFWPRAPYDWFATMFWRGLIEAGDVGPGSGQWHVRNNRATVEKLWSAGLEAEALLTEALLLIGRKLGDSYQGHRRGLAGLFTLPVFMDGWVSREVEAALNWPTHLTFGDMGLRDLVSPDRWWGRQDG